MFKFNRPDKQADKQKLKQQQQTHTKTRLRFAFIVQNVYRNIFSTKKKRKKRASSVTGVEIVKVMSIFYALTLACQLSLVASFTGV